MKHPLVAAVSELVKALVQPDKGTKFLLTAFAMFLIGYKGTATIEISVLIGVILLVYIAADLIATYLRNKKEKT